MQCGLADAHEEEEEAQAHKVLTEYELFGTDDEEGSGDEAVEELESTLQPPKPGGLKYALRGEKVPELGAWFYLGVRMDQARAKPAWRCPKGGMLGPYGWNRYAPFEFESLLARRARRLARARARARLCVAYYPMVNCAAGSCTYSCKKT